MWEEMGITGPHDFGILIFLNFTLVLKEWHI